MLLTRHARGTHTMHYCRSMGTGLGGQTHAMDCQWQLGPRPRRSEKGQVPPPGGGGGGGLQLVLMQQPPQPSVKTRGGGGVGAGGGVGGKGGGCAQPSIITCIPQGGCLGAWGYRGMYVIIAISCLCQEESLKGLKD